MVAGVLLLLGVFGVMLTRPAVRSEDRAPAERSFEERLPVIDAALWSAARDCLDRQRVLAIRLGPKMVGAVQDPARAEAVTLVVRSRPAVQTASQIQQALGDLDAETEAPLLLRIAGECRSTAEATRRSAAAHRSSTIKGTPWLAEWEAMGRSFGPLADSLEAAARLCERRAQALAGE